MLHQFVIRCTFYLFLSSSLILISHQRTLHRLHELSAEAVVNPSILSTAQHIQDIVARADRTIALAGIPGTKYLLSRLYPGYPVAPRRPLRPLEAAAGERLWSEPTVQALLDIETQLARE